MDELEDVDDDSGQLFASIGMSFEGVRPSSRQARFWHAFDEGVIMVADVPHVGVAGFVAAMPLDEEAFVVQLSVRRANQGRGVGRRLMASIEPWARDQGFSGLTLTTFQDVPWNAPFYASLGYSEVPADEIRPGLKAERTQETDRGLDAVGPRIAMRKPLS